MLKLFRASGSRFSHKRLLLGVILGFLMGGGALSLAPVSVAQVPDLGGLGGMLGKKDKKSVEQSDKPAGPDSSNPAGAMFGIVGEMTKEESVEEELEVGRGVAANMLGALKPVPDKKLQAYVGKVGMNIAVQGERKDLPWRFVVVDSVAINAFALPGGIVLITQGLFDLLETEDELAAVLGHEIAHVQRKHHFNVVKQQKMVGGMTAMAGAAIEQQNSLVSGFISRATEVMARGLDKSAEYEADRDGIVLASRAGYDSTAMFGVLEKISASAGSGKDASLLFSTHPSAEERISALGSAMTAPLEDAAVLSPSASRLAAQFRR